MNGLSSWAGMDVPTPIPGTFAPETLDLKPDPYWQAGSCRIRRGMLATALKNSDDVAPRVVQNGA